MSILRNKKTIYICIIGTVLLIASIFLFPYLYNNQYSLDMDIEEGAVIRIEYGVDKELPEIQATYKGTIFDRGGENVKTYVEGEYDLTTIGRYEVTYKAGYKDMICKKNVTIVVEDTTPPTIELLGSPNTYTSPVGKYEEEGYFAYDNYDGDLTEAVVRVEKKDVVSYVVTDSSGNTAMIERKIMYKDVVPPQLTLKGEAYSSITVGTTYVELGYTAVDDCDGDLTDKVQIEGNVDANTCGIYILKYKVTDLSGNTSEIERNITVTDMTPPTIVLKGDSPMYVKLGESFNDPGCTATDNLDGDIVDKITVNGSVDTTKEGLYNIVYHVMDKTGNKAEITRSVYVYEKQVEVNEIKPGDKVVYLTFDDGPGPYTEKLLNILDKYGVKVTFFVTNQNSGYRNLIGEAHRRGHTIALHTYSHKYADIYRSEIAYFEDLQKIHDIVVAQTGVEPKIVRFPGGTSNVISRNYSVGIMTRLSKSLGYRGYLYCDWNVSSGDAGRAKTASQVVANVIAGIKGKNLSVVLQHDTKKYSVEAVEEIIVWGLANGYTFLPMTENTPMVHHGANN